MLQLSATFGLAHLHKLNFSFEVQLREVPDPFLRYMDASEGWESGPSGHLFSNPNWDSPDVKLIKTRKKATNKQSSNICSVSMKCLHMNWLTLLTLPFLAVWFKWYQVLSISYLSKSWVKLHSSPFILDLDHD